MNNIIDLKELQIRKDFILIILILMVLDVITGVVKAFLDKNFQSTIFRQGLYKKVYELIIILVGYILDYVLGLNYIGEALIFMIIGLEAYSIVIENASEYVPIPSWLKQIIEKLKAENKEV